MGLKEQLAGVTGHKEVTITVEAWGFDVTLREPSAGDALKFAKKSFDNEKNVYEMLALCIYEGGERVFKSGSQADASLNDKGFTAIKQLSEACQGLLGIDVDSAAKNSQETPDGFSSTD